MTSRLANQAPPEAPIPPQALEAEESVLGAAFLSPNAIDAVLDTGLRPDDFYMRKHGAIFRAITEMHARQEAVDVITVIDALTVAGKLDDVGGRVRLYELANLVPASANVAHYANIILEVAGARRLIQAGQNIARLGWERPGTLPELTAQAEVELTKAVTTTSTSHAELLTDGLDEMLAEIREAYTTKTPIFGASTGYTTLDTVLSGLWAGQLVLLAARPGMGKSTLALNIAENFADRGETVLFVTLEMSKYELSLRSLARAARVNSMVLATGQMKPDEAKRLGEAVATVKARTMIHVEDNGAVTIPTLRSEARKLKRTEDLRLIVVDYLQLMQGSGEENRTQEISVISRSLKLLARELGIPIIALSQMSRDIERRAEKRPVLADLRDSGSLEQDADVVLFIHADSNYNPDVESDGTVEVIVAKQRKGPTDTIKLAFNKAWSSFKNIPTIGAST